MKAWVEITSGVIRSGPTCDRYGKPYDYAMAFASVDGKTAIIKGLHIKTPPREHLQAGKIALRRIGLSVKRMRYKVARKKIST